MKRAFPHLLLLTGMLMLVPASASAFPSFARKYRISCRNCHERAFPKLNMYGLHFKENGYQLPDGAEGPAVDRAAFEPGTAGENLVILKAVPLSLRIQTHLEYVADPHAGRGPVEIAAPMDIFLFGGGSIAKNISAAFTYSIAPNPWLHYATVGVHNLGGPGVLNIRAGRFLLLDFSRSAHRRLTIRGASSMNSPVGKNPFGIDDHQLGIDMWGRPGRGPLFWEVAIVNGAGDISKPDDADKFKDVFAHLRYTIADRYTTGLFGYVGSAQLTDDTDGVMRTWGDRFWRAGMMTELEFGRVLVHGHAVYGRHRNPEGKAPIERGWFLGTMAQVDISITDRWLTIARYDRVDASDPTRQLQLATANLIYLLATNARLTFEVQQDINALSDDLGEGLEKTKVFLHADIVF